MNFYRITELGWEDGVVHIQNAPGLGGGAALTLCGYVDVQHEASDGPATCVQCRRIVAFCKAIRLRTHFAP